MKRNTITIIEVIIILSVVVVAVGVWNYRNPSPIQAGKIGGSHCPKCGNSEHNKTIDIPCDGSCTRFLKCNKCGWDWTCIEGFDEQCPKCGHIGIKYKKPLEEDPSPYRSCPKCGWHEM